MFAGFGLPLAERRLSVEEVAPIGVAQRLRAAGAGAIYLAVAFTKKQCKMTDNQLIDALKKRGFIVPKTEHDVYAFEQAIKEHNIPPFPADLDDPAAILKQGYSNERKKD